MEIWTLGYEKAGLEDFLATLEAAGIRLVADLRDLPLSRRAGFSKRQFAASLLAHGIGYQHLKALGTPKAGRVAHRARNMKEFWAIYETQLATPEAAAALSDLARLAADRPTCLVCFEADWRVCHRARVVEALAAAAPVDRPPVAHHLTVEPRFA